MSVILSFILVLPFNVWDPSEDVRCKAIQVGSVNQWLSATSDRIRLISQRRKEVARVRDAAWLPTVTVRSKFALDDDERLSLAQDERLQDFRTSSTERGGHEWSLELDLRWKLDKLYASPLELGVRRHHQDLTEASYRRRNQLFDVWSKWLVILGEHCQNPIKSRMSFQAKVWGLEARLDDLSDGLFTTWLKEQSK